MADTGQVTSSAAEFYDAFFVPALFEEWAPRMVAAAGLRPSMEVLDVACGTGILAERAVEAVLPGGKVVGVDLNPGMLAVARRRNAPIEWREAPAESLPYDAGTFDVVTSQFGLMFFRDQPRAIAEMWKVLRPGGRLVVAVWDALEHAPGYDAVTQILSRLFGDRIADLLRSPYSLGDSSRLQALFAEAGVGSVEVRREPGTARFPSIRGWMECDVRGWTLADELDDDQFEQLVSEAERELRRFVTVDGTVEFSHPALIASADKPA
jgi:ubiquinone/menaquinone biosynthesis C-methylase UbiE